MPMGLVCSAIAEHVVSPTTGGRRAGGRRGPDTESPVAGCSPIRARQQIRTDPSPVWRHRDDTEPARGLDESPDAWSSLPADGLRATNLRRAVISMGDAPFVSRR